MNSIFNYFMHFLFSAITCGVISHLLGRNLPYGELICTLCAFFLAELSLIRFELEKIRQLEKIKQKRNADVAQW